MSAPHRVVILGGGFGGLYAAQSLKNAPIDLTLVDRRNFHLFQPLLYQVATGALSPGEIASPLRAILRHQKNTRVLLGEARDFDSASRQVLCDIGPIPYDTLIVACGSSNHYFDHPEWEHDAPGLKTIEDATAIRHKILYAFEAAERESDADCRREWLTFVVVGAGPTGVELAGALAEIAHDTLRGNFRSIRPQEAQILLLDGSPRVLPPYPADLSGKAQKSLERLGVHVRTNVRVVGIDGAGLTLQTPTGQDHIATRTIIWAAGVHATPIGEALAKRTGAQLDRSGRLVVTSDCSLPNHPEIFVIGDLARFEENGKPLTGVAQVAMQQGKYVARLIGKRLKGQSNGKPFHYFDKGDLAVIGRAAAVARIGKLHISGFPAWLIWLFIHLMYLVEFSNRVLVFVQWGFLYITFNRGARLITGGEAKPPG
ncbi:MAG TPA: NAD(P)/FAD-dependent oxidoreductase [Bryobacteraceae bacterium]|nr:NAD(P)/FAD-dependent oxidoreductase [Bryobacteraceae bacterium]